MPRTLLLTLVLAMTPSVFAAETITTDLYNDKGLAGQLITTVQDDKNQNVDFKLEWNNRRVSINEKYQFWIYVSKCVKIIEGILLSSKCISFH